tara:strand:+ start:2757 stop:3791 length:1035 start_codon:yes stop_codon:yes gene_type:complete
MHEQLQMALDAITSRITEDNELIACKCFALMHGYHARWAQDIYKVIDIESVKTSQIRNPDTGAASRTFQMAGKIDVLATRATQTVLIDHKTTSDSIDNPDSPYWRQLMVESQASAYAFLLRSNGVIVDDILWDVMKKPSISPKAVAKAMQKQVMGTGEYFGSEISEDAILAMEQTGRENLEMYQVRLIDDCINVRPEWYFQRQSIMRLDSEILEYGRELWQLSQEIRETANKKRYIKNSKACMMYGSSCAYLGICSGHDTEDSEKWTRKEHVHNELPDLEGETRSFLTNSRITTYMTCRRKHHYKYELGLERTDEEEKEVLRFGSLWHEAQEAWWSYFLPTEES